MGAVVIILKNFVVEEHLMNGSMEPVVDIVYDDPQGNKVIGALSLDVVVDFQNQY